MPDLEYSAFVDELLTALPEAQHRYATLVGELGDHPQQHFTVALILEPMAKQALDAGDRALAARIFAFFEEMARSEDVEVKNLLYVGVFEAWVGQRDVLSRAWRYFGEHTKVIARDAASRLNFEGNLPHG